MAACATLRAMASSPPRIAVIGGGPAGLAAAETLSQAGLAIDLFDAMPSLGRKFLMAGRGGLNLTHSEPLDRFLTRYGVRSTELGAMVSACTPQSLQDWAEGLGVTTFVGSSGRVFPREMKAAPLLRAWLHRLRSAGVRIHVRHRWLGWHADQGLRFATPEGEVIHQVDATVLALGGGSWARLGSDGAWMPVLSAQDIPLAPLQPANCGFEVPWSDIFRTRFAGEPVKNVSASCIGLDGKPHQQQGEFVISEHGVEGGLIYALSAPLRDYLQRDGSATVMLDLLPSHDSARVLREVSHPRGSRSLSSHLQSRLGIAGVKAGLLREVLDKDAMHDNTTLAATIKALPLRLTATRPIDEAISTAGGVEFAALDAHLMLKQLPGVFCAGEMLDWEAPTGGYLLTGCIATGHAAARGVMHWLSATGTLK